MTDFIPHLEIADQLKEFETNYVIPLRRRRDSMLASMEGTVPNEETRKRYEVENSRTEFLEKFVGNIRIIVGQHAVDHHHVEMFLKACEELSVVSEGKFRQKLLSSQSEGLTEAINKLKEAIA